MADTSELMRQALMDIESAEALRKHENLRSRVSYCYQQAIEKILKSLCCCCGVATEELMSTHEIGVLCSALGGREAGELIPEVVVQHSEEISQWEETPRYEICEIDESLLQNIGDIVGKWYWEVSNMIR